MSYSYKVYVVQQQHEVKESTRPTRTFVPVQCSLVSDSLSTGFALLEALSALVPVVLGRYWCGRGCVSWIPRSPNTTSLAAAAAAAAVRTIATFVLIISYDTGTVPGFPRARYKFFSSFTNRSEVISRSRIFEQQPKQKKKMCAVSGVTGWSP